MPLEPDQLVADLTRRYGVKVMDADARHRRTVVLLAIGLDYDNPEDLWYEEIEEADPAVVAGVDLELLASVSPARIAAVTVVKLEAPTAEQLEAVTDKQLLVTASLYLEIIAAELRAQDKLEAQYCASVAGALAGRWQSTVAANPPWPNDAEAAPEPEL